MKISLLVSLLAIAAAGISSYSHKSEDSTIAHSQTDSQVGFRVKVEGADYAPDFSYALARFPGVKGYYAICGLDSKKDNIVSIALPNTAAEGTHILSDINFGVLRFDEEDFSTVNGGSGTITITKKTATNLTGTFSFTAYDVTGTVKRTLKDGAFNVAFR